MFGEISSGCGFSLKQVGYNYKLWVEFHWPKLVSSLKDLHKLETKLLEKQQKEEEFVERQKRLAKIKEKVLPYVCHQRDSIPQSVHIVALS